ncbi:MAG: hypothetical protein NC337_06640 [Roseburia sp.]|nr:hypothetical protein [Roseburia sp.]
MTDEDMKILLKSIKKLNAKKEVLEALKKTDEEYDKLCAVIDSVEYALGSLSNEEREIIEMHLIQGNPWHRVIAKYEEKHGQMQGYSERTYKRIQQKAIKQLADIIEEAEGVLAELTLL